jgi:hypothetical protein
MDRYSRLSKLGIVRTLSSYWTVCFAMPEWIRATCAPCLITKYSAKVITAAYGSSKEYMIPNIPRWRYGTCISQLKYYSSSISQIPRHVIFQAQLNKCKV